MELQVCVKVTRGKFKTEKLICRENCLALVENGSFVVNEQIVHAYECCYFKKGERFDRRVIFPVTMFLFTFEEDINIPSGKIVFRDMSRVKSTVMLLNLAYQNKEIDSSSYIESLFCDLINQFKLENLSNSQNNIKGDKIISDAVRFINENISEQIALPSLAEETGISYVHFARKFKAEMGVTISDYVASQRLIKAKQLILETDLSIKEIASQCGFKNEYYFSNFFKKQTGLSPNNFRAATQSVEKI